MNFEEYYQAIKQRNRLNKPEDGFKTFHYSDATLETHLSYFRGCYILELTPLQALSPLPSPRILNLTLKRRWFDMINEGVKKEEYREIKGYWMVRLTDKSADFKTFDIVRFRLGYATDAPTVDVECVGMGFGYPSNPDWCENMEYGYVIQLGEILKSSPPIVSNQ